MQPSSNEHCICQKIILVPLILLVHIVLIHAIKIELKIYDWAQLIIRKSCALYEMLMHANDINITMSLQFVVFLRKIQNAFLPNWVRSGKGQRKDFITKYVILLWIHTKENHVKESKHCTDYWLLPTTHYEEHQILLLLIIIQRMVKQRTIWLAARDFIYVSSKERRENGNKKMKFIQI